jgi:hypothetical protein
MIKLMKIFGWIPCGSCGRYTRNAIICTGCWNESKHDAGWGFPKIADVFKEEEAKLQTSTASQAIQDLTGALRETERLEQDNYNLCIQVDNRDEAIFALRAELAKCQDALHQDQHRKRDNLDSFRTLHSPYSDDETPEAK